MSTPLHILALVSDPSARRVLVEQYLRPAGHQVHLVRSWPELLEVLQRNGTVDVLLVDEGALPAAALLEQYVGLPLVYVAALEEPRELRRALQLRAVDVVAPPFNPAFLDQALQRALAWRQKWQERIARLVRQTTGRLRLQVDELSTLLRVSRSLLSDLNLEQVLEGILTAAVELTEAEEAVLLLPDPQTGELYIRAAKNLDDVTVRTFRLPVTDSKAGEVLKTGEPFVLTRDAPEKIKTAFLVHSLVYVPLKARAQAIGVLGVYHRTRRIEFTERHIARLRALADYAALALEHATLYAQLSEERHRLGRILDTLQDGVLVLDTTGLVLFFNPAGRRILRRPEHGDTGATYLEVVDDPDVRQIIQDALNGKTGQTEYTTPEGQAYAVQAFPIPGLGVSLTLHDITYFKELDQAKTEFVNTVSHDLRSPLTAILGYVELLERAGPLNDLQKQFVVRVRDNVNHITQLITELLDLGRIEAGFETRQEPVDLAALLRYAVEGLQAYAQEKRQALETDIPESLPLVLGNPVRLRQVFDNLISNAVKYTQEEGRIAVRARVENGHILIEVEDNGPGIPEEELPHIFDKFYRASNVASEVPGTGLGLAIVKSIVERHGGRVWAESRVGKGTKFSVLLPTAAITEEEQRRITEELTRPQRRKTTPRERG